METLELKKYNIQKMINEITEQQVEQCRRKDRDNFEDNSTEIA